jgi:WD40 repeat protein/DNA-binding winged helix-turn-helix (wHTH) protein
MGLETTAVYEFCDLRLDVAKGLLTRSGRAIQLQGKSFELLTILVRSEGRLISRDELMELLWPGTYVEENNLSQQIRAIRRSLVDDENWTEIIETIPRRGIRFIPEVRVVSDAATLPEGSQSALPQRNIAERSRSRRTAYLPWILVGTTITAVVLAVYFGSSYFGAANPDRSRISYGNSMKLALQALNSSNLPIAAQLLEETKPKPGEEDLRGFEWGYLANVLSEASASQPMVLAHESGVDALAFSPDGKTLATAAFDNVIRIWDLSTGNEVRAFSGHTALITFVAFSPDSGALLSTGFDQTARVWDVATGRLLSTTPDPHGSARFSIDGSSIVYANGRDIISVDAATGDEKGRFKSPVEAHAVQFSPNGKLLAIRGHDQSIQILDAADKRAVSTMKGHTDWVMDFQFSPDSNSLVTASKDRTAKLWDVRTGKVLRTLKGHEDEIFEVDFSPDGTTIATGSNDDTLRLWDVASGFEIAKIRAPNDVKALAYSPDGRKLASSGDEGGVRIASTSGLRQRGILRGHSEPVTRIVFSPSGRMLVSSSRDKTARVWDVASEMERLALGGRNDSVSAAIFSSDGSQIATIGEDKKIKLRDSKTGRELMSIDSPVEPSNLAISPDGKLLVTGHTFHDSRIRFWDLTSGTLQCETVDAHEGGPWSFGFTSDDRVVTAALGERTISIWDRSTCSETSSFKGKEGDGYHLSFGPGNIWRALQILNEGRSLKWFEPETGREIATFSGSGTPMSDVQFSPDGKRLITADEAGIIRIWDSATGLELLSFESVTGENNLAISPDGKTLAAGSSDGTIRLFRSSTIE